MKVAVTGFTSFPGVDLNISETLVHNWIRSAPNWKADATRFEVLPTAYDDSRLCISNLIETFRPHILVMLGVAGISSTLQFERIALNIDDCVSPDIHGIVKMGRRIADHGPAAILTAVDLDRLREYVIRKKIDVQVSNHAGTYVCNHAYYCALLSVASLHPQPQILFVHLPNGLGIVGDAQWNEIIQRCQGAVEVMVNGLLEITGTHFGGR